MKHTLCETKMPLNYNFLDYFTLTFLCMVKKSVVNPLLHGEIFNTQNDENSTHNTAYIINKNYRISMAYFAKKDRISTANKETYHT